MHAATPARTAAAQAVFSQLSLTDTTEQPRSLNWRMDPQRAFGALAGDPVQCPHDQRRELADVRVVELLLERAAILPAVLAALCDG